MHGDNLLQQQDDMLKINTSLHQLLHQNIKMVAREKHESHQVKLGHNKMCWVTINIIFYGPTNTKIFLKKNLLARNFFKWKNLKKNGTKSFNIKTIEW